MENHYNFSSEKEIDKAQLKNLFQSVGWRTAEYPNRLQQAIKNSHYVLSVWNDNELIGLISAISDGYINMFITYLLIKPEYQKKGLGTTLVNKLCDNYQGFGRRILTTEMDKEKYYNKFGFGIDGISMFNYDWKDDNVN